MDLTQPTNATRQAGRASAFSVAGLCLLWPLAGALVGGCETDHSATRGCETEQDCFANEMCGLVGRCVARTTGDAGAGKDAGTAGGADVGRRAEIADDFGGTELDPTLWEARQVGTFAAEVDDGALVVAAPKGQPGGSFDVRGRFQLEGDYDVWIGYEWLVYGGEFHANLNLLVVRASDTPDLASTADGFAEMDRVVINAHRYGGGKEHILDSVLAGKRERGGVRLGTPVAGKLRLRREGTDVAAYHWEAGDWVTIGKAKTFGEPGRLFFKTSNRDDCPAVEVRWDDLHVSAGGLVPGAPASPGGS